MHDQVLSPQRADEVNMKKHSLLGLAQAAERTPSDLVRRLIRQAAQRAQPGRAEMEHTRGAGKMPEEEDR